MNDFAFIHFTLRKYAEEAYNQLTGKPVICIQVATGTTNQPDTDPNAIKLNPPCQPTMFSN